MMKLKKKKKSLKNKRETLFDINWNNKFELLKKFRKRFRHCNVPQNWKENPSLGRWVIKQRVYKDLLTTVRIDKLDQIGFTWNIYGYLWEDSYGKLISFKKKFGHCEVPKGRKEYAKLAEWVGKQRSDKRKNLKRLGAEKIKKLNKIGFYWGRKNTPWDKRFEELKAFKARFGHCRVPQSWKENRPLANWVAHQRRGRHKLSRERMNKLNQQGFKWIIFKKRKS